MKAAATYCLLIAVLGSVASSQSDDRKPIAQSGFATFHRGLLGNSGANLYVSRSGRLQVINKWDIDGDGYNDVLISNDHDVYETVDAFIYWNSSKGVHSLLPDLWRNTPLAQIAFDLMDKPSGITRLPAFGGGHSLIADLNRDGYPDIVFCNYIHNYPGNRSAYIYWGGPDGYKSDRKQELPTMWAAGVAAADLNGDGYPDLVFANQGAEAGLESLYPNRDIKSYIYWGGPSGFDSSNVTLVPTRGARDVAIGDINHDGYPDLAFINNGPKAHDLQVFFGDKGGYSTEHSQTIPIDNPTSIRSADVNRDGYSDLIVATGASLSRMGFAEKQVKETNSIQLFFGGAEGVSAGHSISLPAYQPRDIAVADFNRDGFPDIAIANSSDGTSPVIASYVYWGSAHGFDPRNRIELPTLGASGVGVTDINGDGFPDLIFANSHNDTTYDVPSYIYWGSSTGFAPYLRSQIQSFGAASTSVGDLNGDGRPEIVLVNQYSGSFKEVNTNIFWGNPHHYYSPASMSSVPGIGTYGTTVADLNDDGFADLVLCSSYPRGTYIYWGGKDGFSTTRRQTLPVASVLTSSAADLNGDGYLDLLFAGSLNGKPTGTILWGSKNGFSEAKRTTLPLKLTRSPSGRVADLNHDGYLDLIFSDSYFPQIQIFWGGPEGYSEKRSWSGTLRGGGNLELADLNGDGFLDFIFAGMFDPVRKSYDTRTRIYWGTAAGVPSLENPVELEAYGSVECAIADLNHDGNLDLVFSSYMSDRTRSLPLFIYWGDKGRYSNANRTLLPAESSAGIQTVDLNKDGYPDIIVANHLKDGHHTGVSYIYWNGPRGFDKDRRTELPTFGPHYSQRVDPGNLYSRKLEEEYLSEPIELPSFHSSLNLSWKAEEPHGSKLKFQIRTASTQSKLSQAAWIGPRGPNSYYVEPGSRLGRMRPENRWIQYRVLFTSPDAGDWPVLTSIEFEPR